VEGLNVDYDPTVEEREEIECAQSEIRARIESIEGLSDNDDDSQVAQEAIDILQTCDEALAKLLGGEPDEGNAPEGSPTAPGDRLLRLVVSKDEGR
jgi:hypothetical protein